EVARRALAGLKKSTTVQVEVASRRTAHSAVSAKSAVSPNPTTEQQPRGERHDRTEQAEGAKARGRAAEEGEQAPTRGAGRVPVPHGLGRIHAGAKAPDSRGADGPGVTRPAGGAAAPAPAASLTEDAYLLIDRPEGL